LGIGLYGVGDGTKPISRLTTRIVQVKELEEGETVGYGRVGRIERPTTVATIPIGYADGLDRRLGGGVWSVGVGGKRAPIIGRVCMDSCMIDVTGIECTEGSEVVIFGGEGGSVVEMAELLGTIPYEVMTSVSSRVKRIYVKE
jgi:alanine racemase